jgi:hypothetical protein
MASTNDAELKTLEEKAPGPGDAVLDASGASSTSYDEEKYHMSGSKLGVLITGLCLALFLLGLDTAIVSTVSYPERHFWEKI